MKFYKVQPALEAGKKIRRSDMKGYLFLDDDDIPNRKKIRYVLPGAFDSNPYHMVESELLADDWEIVEDIPEIQLFRSKNIYFVCPKCEMRQEQIVYSEDRDETVHTCRHCGQKYRFSNLEEDVRKF